MTEESNDTLPPIDAPDPDDELKRLLIRHADEVVTLLARRMPDDPVRTLHLLSEYSTDARNILQEVGAGEKRRRGDGALAITTGGYMRELLDMVRESLNRFGPGGMMGVGVPLGPMVEPLPERSPSIAVPFATVPEVGETDNIDAEYEGEEP